jgi:hypothetical protein
MGAGNDTFQWDPGDGSDTVEGQGGSNALQFDGSNAAEKIDVSANGSRVRLFRDVAAITMDLGGVQTLNVRTLAGADTVTVGDLDGTDVKDTNVDLGEADGSADTVVAAGTAGDDAAQVSQSASGTAVYGIGQADVNVTGGEPALDAVELSGGAGSDTTSYVGTNGPDTIGIALDGVLPAAFTTGALPVLAATENLDVQGLGGNDTIQGQNGLSFTSTKLTVDGGNGDDTLGGGDGDDLLLGGAGNDVIDGNRGADTALMGAGNDTFQWDPGDGSDTVEGQAGNDTLRFNGSNAAEKIDVSANGSRGRLFRDIAAITMDFDGVEQVGVNPFGSTDTITVDDLSGTAVKSTDIDLSAGNGGGGDGSADTVIANGTAGNDRMRVTRSGGQVAVNGLSAQTTIVGAEPALDSLQVNALDGDDDVAVASDVRDLIQTAVDLGPGE